MSIDGIIAINLVNRFIDDLEKGIVKAKDRKDLIESNEYSISNMKKVKFLIVDLECRLEAMRLLR
jgi:hypothetical protein